ncbi:MAG: hypothetical protein RL071_3363 [Pseudomonadota bacterium]
MPQPPSDLKPFIELIDCGVVVHAADGTISACNRRALDVLGMSHAQVVGSAPADPRWSVVDEAGTPLPPDQHPASITLRTGAAVRDKLIGVFRPQLADWCWLLVTAQPQRADDGSLHAVVVTFAEVSARVRAEAALRADHALHALVMDTVLSGITLLDPQGRIIFANRRAEAILGLSRGAIEGRLYDDPAWRLEAPDGGPIDSSVLPFVRVRDGLTPVSDVRHAIRWPDGRRRILSVNGAPVLDADGALKSLVFAIDDHTELYEKERALQHASSRLALALESAALGVVEGELSRQHSDLRIDPEWMQRTGSHEPEATRRDIAGWLKHLHPKEAARVSAALEAVLQRSTDQVDVEFDFGDVQGAYHRFHLRGRVTPSARDAETLRFSGVLREVTAEHTARAAAERDRARIFEITRLESLALMAGGVAHEFNNLLVGILGGASSALDEIERGHPVRETLELMLSTAHRAAALTRQLLAYSGQGRFSMQPLQLADLIDELRGMLGASDGRRGQLELQLSRGVGPVEGDPAQLRQLTLNLVLNAWEALPDQGGRVLVRVSHERLSGEHEPAGLLGPARPAPGVYQTLTVEDNGSGVDGAALERIFEPFFSTKPGRHGLGLPAVLGVVRGHGGWIAVRSLSPGTRVQIGLPVAAPAPAAAPPNTVRVLLADDEEVVRRVSARILRRAGFEVEEVCDGAEALQRFYAEPDHFDVVLLDLVMPVIDGEAAFVALRQLRPRQPVLLMSGYSKADVVSRAVGTGLVGFLRKPFTSKDLVNAIREVIDDAALHTAEGARAPADPQG